MKKLATLIRHSLIPFVLLLILSCQKELVTTETDLLNKSHDSISNLSIEEAKRYFDTNFSSATIKKSHSYNAEQLFEHKSSKWEKAGYKQISFGDAVVVPMRFEELNLVIDKKTGAYVPYDQLNYLMMYKDKQKNIVTEWVTLLPDSSWLYGKRDVYTGDIMVRTWEGEYLKMYRYSKDGQVKAFNINPSTLQNSKTSDYSAGTYTECMRVRIAANCTCIDKFDCDMCLICAPEFCYTVTLVTDDPEPAGGQGDTGGTGAGNTNNSGGTGTSSGNGSNYTPSCNPNIPPGTWVPSNQLPPCNPTTPVGPITVRYPIDESFFTMILS
ncbi:hypothetical protein [Dyadobacter psychrotolerans]|uniref:Lipoprotein n=1 Tax=Dyadobacter psychrotolerans TaxID=2541721 RepID=A0A4R5DHN7_9BACT|nr:hypothetical protein [Dyadobacter psychrotolerans]TDE10013.1 hypothetical protein E0F88_29240 [Dyadobacter psychrotolerans]